MRIRALILCRQLSGARRAAAVSWRARCPRRRPTCCGFRPAPRRPPAATAAAACWCSVPKAGPGLDSERIALLRSDRASISMPHRAGLRPLRTSSRACMVDQLRSTGMFSAVFDDSSPYAADLQSALRTAPLRGRLHGGRAECRPFTWRSTAPSDGIVIARCSRVSPREVRRRPAKTGSVRSSRHSKRRPPRRSREMERQIGAALASGAARSRATP